MRSRPYLPAASAAVGVLVAGLLATGGAAAEGAAPTATTYTLSPASSRLFVMVYKDQDALGAKLSHDHVIAARGWTGTVVWSPDDPASCRVDISLPVDKLDPDPPKLRQQAGFKRMLTDDDRAEVKKNMLSEEQLWGAKHPTIRFVGTKCSVSDGKVAVTGALTLRGKTREVTAAMKVGIDVETGQLSASGSIVLRATWFGFEPYSALGGALRNKDEMRLFIVASGKPQ